MLATIAIGLLLQGEIHDLAWASAKYKEFGLPMPPVSAPLVALKQREQPVIGYRIGDEVQFGVDRIPFEESQYELFNPSFDAVPDIALEGAPVASGGSVMEQSDPAFVVALIEQSRGNRDFARALMDRMGDRRLELAKGEVPQVELRLGTLARRYWIAQTANPKSSRSEIVTRLRQIFDTIPSAETKSAQTTIQMLLLADSNRYQASDPVEKLVDSFCDYSLPRMFYAAARFSYDWPVPSPPNPFGEGQCLALSSLGFKAIPSLIEHADDGRGTRSFKSWKAGYLDPDDGIYTVGEMCRLMLGYLQGRLTPNEESAANLRTWWDSNAGTEEEYCLKLLDPKVEYPDTIIRICQLRYPNALASAFKASLTSQGPLTSKLVKALGDPMLPRGITIDALVGGCKSSSWTARLLCLSELQKLDARKFDVELVRTYALLPKQLGDDENTETMIQLVNLVGLATSSSAWEELQKSAHRATPESRAWLLKNLTVANLSDEAERRHWHFLLSFLDDRTPIKWASVIMMVDTHVIADIAADKAASSLGMDICKESKASGWERFRKDVRVRLLEALNRTSG